MRGDISERDWKIFRELHSVWLERFCDNVLNDAKRELGKTRDSKHESYLALYKLLQRRDRELANACNDFRRSTAVVQIAIIRKTGVITTEELERFSAEMR